LIGALKKAGSGAVDGVVDRYCLIFLYYLSNKYAHMTFYMLYADTTCLFHRSEMSTVQIMIQISFATIQLLFTLFLFGMYYYSYKCCKATILCHGRFIP
jgi:hypothetical protein